MTPDTPYLDAERLLHLLRPATALNAVQTFFSQTGPEQVAVPTRIHMNVPGVNTLGLYMPAATGNYVGVKIVHLMPERRPSVEAEIFLYNAETGKLLFWGDGKPLTALRTAAVSVAASLPLLTRCERLVVYGAGVQAASHLEAFASACPGLNDLAVVARSPESFQRLQALLSENLRDRVRRSENPGKDLETSDCVVATTPSPDPLFQVAALPGTCHVVGIGSATPAMNELPPEVFQESRVWVDTSAALTEAGDLIEAGKIGWSADRLEGDLFALLGSEGPKSPPGGRTLFKSVGHAAQDLSILIRLWELMEAEGKS